MAYKILSTEVRGETIVTKVQYDSVQDAVEVAHFQPKSVEEVLTNIEIREETELVKLSAEVTNAQIKSVLDDVVGVDSVNVRKAVSAFQAKDSVRG